MEEGVLTGTVPVSAYSSACLGTEFGATGRVGEVRGIMHYAKYLLVCLA